MVFQTAFIRKTMLAGVLSLLVTATAQGEWVVEVTAGDYDRITTPVSVELPAVFPGHYEQVVLVDEQSGLRRAAQIDTQQPKRMWWIETMPAGAERRYRVESVDRAITPLVTSDDDGSALILTNQGRPVLAYQHQILPSPVADKPFHARSGFIRSVFSPSGKELTDSMPADHLHQHGVMFAWRDTQFEGRSVNFWEDAAQQGRISHLETIDHSSGPVFGEFAVRLEHVDMTAPAGMKQVLSEVWRVRAYATATDFVWDLESTQTASSPSPLHMNQFHYGGLMIRGSAEWIKSPHEILTSNGDGRLSGNHTRPLWVDIHGAVAGEHVGLTTMGHPTNFRFPQPVRLHPTMPYYCFAPMVEGEFDIVPDRPYASRFRFIAHDGPLPRLKAVAYWRDWVNPPTAHISRRGD